jgi:hypothetical protein
MMLKPGKDLLVAHVLLRTIGGNKLIDRYLSIRKENGMLTVKYR